MNGTRREFMSNVGRGMLVAGLGGALANDLGFSTAFAETGDENVPLGNHQSLVELIRQTPAEKLQPLLVQKIQAGKASLKEVTAASALANAVTFGGCDYVGFHTAMAMLPALEMSNRLGDRRAPLPILKVAYRNAQQIQSVGGANTTAIHAFGDHDHTNAAASETSNRNQAIRDACREGNTEQAENLLHAAKSQEEAFNAIQLAVQDDMNVHRFVLAHRANGLANLLGTDYAFTMLRQSVRFCANQENERKARNQPEPVIRALLPQLLDQHHLAGFKPGKRPLSDAELLQLAETIYQGPCAAAAEAVATAIAEGFHPEQLGEAISLASNMFVLRQSDDKWRTHGDSAGVHSSDASNAWRNMTRVVAPDLAISGLIVAAYHVGVQSDPFSTPAYPLEDDLQSVEETDPKALLSAAEEAIRANDQRRITALIQKYGDSGHDVNPVLDLMLKYAVSEDGRLHGEKYFHTVCEEFGTTRQAYRWRQIVGLARVTASSYGYNREDEHGFRAAGYEEACHLLGVDA